MKTDIGIAKIFKSDAIREAGKLLKKTRGKNQHEKKLQKIRRMGREKAYKEALEKVPRKCVRSSG